MSERERVWNCGKTLYGERCRTLKEQIGKFAFARGVCFEIFFVKALASAVLKPWAASYVFFGDIGKKKKITPWHRHPPDQLW
jgi:hypothetical protein